jgi:hypothetical protein
MNKLKGTHDKLLDLEEFQKIDDLGKIDELKALIPEQNIDKLIREEVEEDNFDINVALENKKYPIKVGDVFILGDHKLICGDSTEPKHIKKLFGDEKVDLMLTDPPYGVDYVSKTKFLNQHRKGSKIYRDIEGDDLKSANYFGFCHDFLTITPWADYNSLYIFLYSLIINIYL